MELVVEVVLVVDEPGTEDVVVDDEFVEVIVVVVDVEVDVGEPELLTRPKGPLSPGAGRGVLKGFEGRPGWLAPRASTTAKAATPTAMAPREPKATGRAKVARRSRRDSVRRLRSSSGVRCPRCSSHDMSPADA